MEAQKGQTGRKYKVHELHQLKKDLKEAGISQVTVAKYADYYVNQVNQALQGVTTITKVVEAARELLVDPSLADGVESKPHPLKAKLAEAGLAGKDLMRATGQTSSPIKINASKTVIIIVCLFID